ncbi:sensor histidine kinase [Entomomonas asaccharolytica]|uniref:histidine kinase n=1 Tax=Entomomonas asaccharolytica TaxID=2785331 RepID=A0A974RX97_9GAMM|nr:HAMP domain-containing sensor histidine kinase [Entomomonas asaccharolytica]QQP85957.1 HAMP domain-containing histidine kinase [Entomomonas asaccharolytica]
MTTSKAPKSYAFFLIIGLIIFGLVGYLGFRTIEHQALLKHYQIEEIAQSRINEADKFIKNLLNQKATRLDAIANFLQLDDYSLKQFTDNDTDVDNLFILQNNQLTYPNQQTDLSQKQQQLIATITPLINDPNSLYAPSITNENIRPHSGWYINYSNQTPLLIYWSNKDSLTIGFCISYVNFLADVINNANLSYDNGSLKITENDRLLYQSTTDINNLHLLANKNLAYPLTNWQISYYGEPTHTLAIYLWGIVIILLLLIAIGLILYNLYREYMRTTRQAMQQVNFVSQVSHELKTPLTNITLYAELLKEEQEAENTDQQAYTEVIINESQRLSRLIQNILSFTKTPKIHLTTFNLSETLIQIAHTFSPSFKSKGINLVLTIPDNIKVTSDIDRVTQIICNFLSNSEKYAAQGKQVDLSLMPHTNYIDIQVRDYGNGIANKEHKLIFTPFYRIKSTITEGVSGTGIGLTIAKQLATSLQAEILITNTNPGVCFTLRLWQLTDSQGTGN